MFSFLEVQAISIFDFFFFSSLVYMGSFKMCHNEGIALSKYHSLCASLSPTAESEQMLRLWEVLEDTS